jgi:hypothetical protein
MTEKPRPASGKGGPQRSAGGVERPACSKQTAPRQDRPGAIHSAGFIRVIKRKLKGGHPDLRAYRAEAGELATVSRSFALVRAVRIDGKPRHVFVLGLGAQKDWERAGHITEFWRVAVRRMKRYGLTRRERRRLVAEMVRKGAQMATAGDWREGAEKNLRDAERLYRRRWLKLRYRVLKLHGAACQCCGRKDRPLQVDHIKPRSKFPELALSIENLQVLCCDCNFGKADIDETDWRNAAHAPPLVTTEAA